MRSKGGAQNVAAVKRDPPRSQVKTLAPGGFRQASTKDLAGPALSQEYIDSRKGDVDVGYVDLRAFECVGGERNFAHRYCRDLSQ